MSYNHFAWYYDSLMDPQFYEDYFHYIQKQVPYFNHGLDLGCGTGTLTDKFQNIEGIDLSAEMIEIAKQKYPRIHFSVGDMLTFYHPASYDCILCLCDSLNYVLGFEAQCQVLKNCYDNLMVGGTLIFDVHSEKKMNETFLDYCEEEEDDEVYFYWSVKKTGDYEITHVVIIEDLAEDLRMEEKHLQQSFPLSWYLKALSEIGFRQIQYEDVFQDEQRLVFTAKKGEF